MGFTERGSMYESGRGRGVSFRNGKGRKQEVLQGALKVAGE